MIATFRCGHPNTPENSVRVGKPRRDGSRCTACRFCQRIRSIVRSTERIQARINANRMTLGQRIAAGLA